MGNMSYCRWENTAGDMWDCVRAQRDGFDPHEASSSERDGYYEALEAAAEMLQLAADAGHLEDNAAIDVTALVEALGREVNDG